MSNWGILTNTQILTVMCLFFLIASGLYTLIRWSWQQRRSIAQLPQQVGQDRRLEGAVASRSDRSSTPVENQELTHLRLLQSVVVNANDAILISTTEPISDTGPSIVYVNKAFTRMTGYSFEEVVGKTPRILQSAKTDRSQLDKIRAALLTWQPVRVELINSRKDGSDFWVELNIVPVADEQGWFTHWISVQRDITEQKKVEQALRESQQHCKLAVASGKMGLWDWNLKTQEIYLDPNLKAMMGVGGDEISNYVQSWSQLVYPEDLEQLLVAANEHLEGLKPEFEIEYRMLHQDGSFCWVYAHGRAIRDASGFPERMMGINADITERKQAEIALQRSESRFREVFDEAPIGIALSYSDEQLFQVNRTFCQMLGYSGQELNTLNLKEITHPLDLEAEQAHFQQLLDGEISVYQLEKRYVKKNKDFLWTQVTRGVIRDQNNRVLHLLNMIQDITERRQVEKMKDDFVSIVSHELRTPLTSLRGALGLLSTGKLGELGAQGKRMLEFALIDTDLLVRLVADILDLERLKSGTLTLAPQICHTAELLQQVVQIMQPLAMDAQITLVVNVVEAPVWTDRDHIVQTLTNLLGNAIKFSPPGSTIWLSAKLQGNEAMFQVKDQGRGIPADKLEIIFERFQQVDASDSWRRGGTGLGLAICRSIVQQHGGRIWAESVVGVGSTFYFTIPLLPQELIP